MPNADQLDTSLCIENDLVRRACGPDGGSIQKLTGELLSALRSLDAILGAAVETCDMLLCDHKATGRFRGLYITRSEIEELLERGPGASLLHVGESLLEHCSPGSALRTVQERFSLSDFDLSVAIIALAPELDLRYERIYAYLQDDVTRKRPTVHLMLELLCSSAPERLERRSRFGANAPLLKHGLIRLISDAGQAEPPLLATFVSLDEQFLNILLGNPDIDGRLAMYGHLSKPEINLRDLPITVEIRTALLNLVQREMDGQSVIFHMRSRSRFQMRGIAEGAARERCARLFELDLSRLQGSTSPQIEELLRLAVREAERHRATLLIEGVESSHHAALSQCMPGNQQQVFLASTPPAGFLSLRDDLVIHLNLADLDLKLRSTWWRHSLSARGVEMSDAVVDSLASRFRLTPEQIDQAVRDGCNRAQWRSAIECLEPGPAGVTNNAAGEMYAAARTQCGSELASLARKLHPVRNWNDVILPANTLLQLQEISQRIKLQERVMTDWGFGRKLSLGKGTSVLFAGASGTGKTLSAEIIANDVQLDLYKIDLAGVVSKYIGETEKNLDRIFTAAEGSNAILFFDEADALFGKRSEVRDSHDRYANIEISYLLQKMETYEGTAILATNLRQHMDDAFVRRLAFTVLFPFPDAAERRLIWDTVWPAEIPIEHDMNFDDLATRFKVTGGNIKNIALAAAFLAAADGGEVRMKHLLHATRREFQKMGKELTEAELCGGGAEGRSEARAAARGSE